MYIVWKYPHKVQGVGGGKGEVKMGKVIARHVS